MWDLTARRRTRAASRAALAADADEMRRFVPTSDAYQIRHRPVVPSRRSPFAAAVSSGPGPRGSTRGVVVTGYSQVAVSPKHACALKGGEPVCWGDNSFGQTDSVPGPYTTIQAGWRATCGLRATGEVICWGCIWDGY